MLVVVPKPNPESSEAPKMEAQEKSQHMVDDVNPAAPRIGHIPSFP